jgi:hypothetical protein
MIQTKLLTPHQTSDMRCRTPLAYHTLSHGSRPSWQTFLDAVGEHTCMVFGLSWVLPVWYRHHAWWLMIDEKTDGHHIISYFALLFHRDGVPHHVGGFDISFSAERMGKSVRRAKIATKESSLGSIRLYSLANRLFTSLFIRILSPWRLESETCSKTTKNQPRCLSMSF